MPEAASFPLMCPLSRALPPGSQDSGLWHPGVCFGYFKPSCYCVVSFKRFGCFQQGVLSELEELLRLLGNGSQAGSLWVLGSSDCSSSFQKPKGNRLWLLRETSLLIVSNASHVLINSAWPLCASFGRKTTGNFLFRASPLLQELDAVLTHVCLTDLQQQGRCVHDSYFADRKLVFKGNQAAQGHTASQYSSADRLVPSSTLDLGIVSWKLSYVSLNITAGKDIRHYSGGQHCEEFFRRQHSVRQSNNRGRDSVN